MSVIVRRIQIQLVYKFPRQRIFIQNIKINRSGFTGPWPRSAAEHKGLLRRLGSRGQTAQKWRPEARRKQPEQRLNERRAESAGRSARGLRPDRGSVGAAGGSISIGTVGARYAAPTNCTRLDRVRLGTPQRGTQAGSLPRPHREGHRGGGAIATDAARRDPDATQPQGAGARWPTGNGQPEAGIRDAVTANRSRAGRRLGPSASDRAGSSWNGCAHRKRPGRSRALRSVQHGNRRGHGPGVVDQKSR
ncbi:hypothetical protein JOE48_004156 [Methylobacterium sp. PvR107]|nr:hypothetical protein [Methylobacterium sp. PvR107]